MPMKSGQNSRHHQRARISHCITWIVFFEIINLFISQIVNYLSCADKPTSKQVHVRCFYWAAQSSTCPQVTYTSDRRQLQMHRAGAAGSKGCQPARGRRLLLCPTAKNKSSTNGGQQDAHLLSSLQRGAAGSRSQQNS